MNACHTKRIYGATTAERRSLTKNPGRQCFARGLPGHIRNPVSHPVTAGAFSRRRRSPGSPRATPRPRLQDATKSPGQSHHYNCLAVEDFSLAQMTRLQKFDVCAQSHPNIATMVISSTDQTLPRAKTETAPTHKIVVIKPRPTRVIGNWSAVLAMIRRATSGMELPILRATKSYGEKGRRSSIARRPPRVGSTLRLCGLAGARRTRFIIIQWPLCSPECFHPVPRQNLHRTPRAKAFRS